MTLHEPLERTLTHKLPDRLPIVFIWPRNETIAAVREYFRANSKEEVLRIMGTDSPWFPMPASYLEFKKSVNGSIEGDALSAGRKYVFHDARTFEDP